MECRLRWTVCALALVLAATVHERLAGIQTPGSIRDWDDGVKYARGQNIVPVFEGWVANPDGTFSLVFGYLNRNWEETVYLPVGPDNQIEPGGPDRGQPTVFTPRRGKNLFEIVVPKDFGKQEIVWTLTVRGRTERAYGALVSQQAITRRMVMAGGELSAAAAAGNDDVGNEADPNRPPSISVDPVQPVAAPGPATLIATLLDDGIGRPGRRDTPAPLRVGWSLYRGPTAVRFGRSAAEPQELTPKGGRATTDVRFQAPGLYVLRATVTDQCGLAVNRDVTVVVR